MAISEYLDSMDFTTLRKLILDMAPEDVDKSEGSFMYDAVTPIALFVSEIMNQMKMVLEQSFIGTANGENLDMIAATMPRIYRAEASPEKLTLRLEPSTEDIKSYILNNSSTLKFSNSNGETFSVDIEQEDWIVYDESSIYLKAIKDVSGIGYSIVGQNFEPSPAIAGLSSCLVQSVTSSGTERETDDHLRVRVWAAMSSPFLGSMADYQRKVFSDFPLSQNGFNVENCFIIPRGSKSGYICVIPAKIGNNGEVRHCTGGELLSLQNYLDKRVDGIGGYGMGVAPIGHVVKVRDFSEFALHQRITVLVAHGKMSSVSLETVRELVTNATNSYLRSIINETVPSRNNYMQNTNRLINFFIYYYLNAHEYSVLSALKNALGETVIRNVTIERKMMRVVETIPSLELTGTPSEVHALYTITTPGADYYSVSCDEFEDLTALGTLEINDGVLCFVESDSSSAQVLNNIKVSEVKMLDQSDLVIRSGGSVGSLPVIGSTDIETVEAEA